MPLDPQVAAFLEQQAQIEAPPITEQTPAMAREGYLALATALGEGADVDVRSGAAPGPAGEIPLRIYSPKGVEPAGGRGALVYYHGGGWVIGDLDTHDHACRALCAGADCIVVSVDYRLAPEHPFPAAVEDAYAALEWAATHSDDIGASNGRIAVGGDSAGGNLSAVVSLLARDDEAGPEVRFQLLVYPAVEMDFGFPSVEENGEGYVLTKDHMTWFRNHYLGGDLSQTSDIRASPLRADSHSDLPPALIQTAEYDPLRDEGEAYAKALAAAGVDVQVTRYDGMVHIFFQLSPIVDGGRQAIDEACTALRTALGATAQ